MPVSKARFTSRHPARPEASALLMTGASIVQARMVPAHRLQPKSAQALGIRAMAGLPPSRSFFDLPRFRLGAARLVASQLPAHRKQREAVALRDKTPDSFRSEQHDGD